MAKAQLKQAKQTNTTATELVNKEAAERAICAFLNISYPSRYDWVKTKQKSVEEFYLSVAVPPKHTVVDVCVLWPEGQDGHGSVTVTVPPLEGDGVSIGGNELKYVCWKNEKGDVEVTEWTEPPKMYEYWLMHGVKYPRNKNQIDSFPYAPSFLILVVCVGVSFAIAVLTEVFWYTFTDVPMATVPMHWDFISAVVLVGGVVGGFLIAVFFHHGSTCDCSISWERDSKKTKDAAKETRAYPSPSKETVGGKSIVN